jgi:hypothetical protein
MEAAAANGRKTSPLPVTRFILPETNLSEDDSLVHQNRCPGLNSPSAREKPDHENHHGHEQQNVQDTAEGLTGDQPNEPQYQKQYDKSLQHLNFFLPCLFVLLAPARHISILVPRFRLGRNLNKNRSYHRNCDPPPTSRKYRKRTGSGRL